MRRLSELEPGDAATVIKVHGEGPLRRRLLDMGLIRGTVVTAVKRAPLGDPLELRIRGYELSLRKAEAEAVEIG
ncbi:MAG: ferrous iron transport protein A [Euryarchaeota archaeon]|nr:ferrous iron transport protein A [Euryarchaeota archaeon]